MISAGMQPIVADVQSGTQASGKRLRLIPMPPWLIILTGFVLSLMGVALPLLMVIHALPSTFVLNFFSFTASMSGLILGLLGASLYVRARRKCGEGQTTTVPRARG